MEPLHRLLGVFCGAVALAALVWVGRYSSLAILDQQRAKAEEEQAWQRQKEHLQAIVEDRKERERRQQEQAVLALAKDQKPDVADKPPFPKLVVDAVVFELGTIHVDQEFRHKFTIRNIGEAPLILHGGPTSHTSEPQRREIPPGGSIDLEIAGTPRFSTKCFAKTRHWWTNDPARRELELRVYGAVVASEPRSVQGRKPSPK